VKEERLTEADYWKKLEELVGKSFVQFVKTNGQLENDLDKAKNYYQKLISLKTYYENNQTEILETYHTSKYFWFTVYPTDWSKLFTEIEFQAWCAIREKGRIVLYPQYPVDNYFLDFGNPGLKIGLELDGKKFHDKEKDKYRDFVLKTLGWTIFRISGKEMYRTNYTSIEELDYQEMSEQDIYEKLSYWLLETGDGVIQAIKEIYFESQNEVEYEDEEWDFVESTYRRLCQETLDKHKST
jgi:very-short-patch-repair endonuclease